MPQTDTPPGDTRSSLRDWLRAGPFGLTLSSGFFGFYAHCGLLSVLEEESLSPASLSGSSAGALIAGLWAAGLDTGRMRDELFRLERRDFWDPAPGLGLLRGRRFRSLLETLLPVREFAECRVPLALSAYDVLGRRTRVLEQGALAPAIQASCSVPLMFHPVWLERRPLLDGGLTDRPGLAGMRAPRVLYHHLASRSPWRGRHGAHTRIPQPPGLQAIVIDGLPRVGPRRLMEGPRAYAAARAALQAALDRPLPGSLLRLHADA